MPRNWLHIARAEFYVLTASLRPHRLRAVVMLYAIGVLWAVWAAPAVTEWFLSSIVPLDQLRPLLIVLVPGLIRSAVVVVWLMLFLFPLSYALQEIKVGQWEILLSNNVRTRDILLGTFLGMTPVYGFVTLVLAPLLVAPVVVIFDVSPLGSILMYTLLFASALLAIWLSNFVIAVVQSKLGDSPRGNDLAKALALVVALVALGPFYGLMYFAPAMSEVLSMDVFLVLPFSWMADLLTWVAISFSGATIAAPQMTAIRSVLVLEPAVLAVLSGAFFVLCIGVALAAADRVFTISAGARTEVVTTIRGENFFLRGIRRLFAGPFGVLVVCSFKDFFRKAQNLSKVFYSVVLAVLLPVLMLTTMDEGPRPDVGEMVMFLGTLFTMTGVVPFVGVSFLESRDQLWTIQSSPSGAQRFVIARLVTFVLTLVVICTVPAVAFGIILGLGPLGTLGMYLYIVTVASGGAMVATGITARNPDYEDTKSAAHQTNTMLSIFIPMIAVVFPLLLMLVSLIMGVGDEFLAAIGPENIGLFVMLSGSASVVVTGLVVVLIGVRSLAAPDK